MAAGYPVGSGPFVPGGTFVWNSGGRPVHSRIALAIQPRILAWSGTALGLHAVHVWTLTPEPDGVLVRTQESMSGPPLSLVYKSADLQSTDERRLRALKRIAETSLP